MITALARARLPLIESLRAIAALLIFAYHALFVTGNLSSTHYGWYLNVGVPLFYAISGLLLFRPFAESLVSGEAPSGFSAYARHRVFRIVPAYWVALPIIAIVLGRTAQVFTFSGVITYFGMLQAYSLETFVGGIGQAWTLTVEVAFYIFLPFWAWVCSLVVARGQGDGERLRRLLLMIGLAAAASLAWKLAVVHHVGDDIPSAVVPLTALPAALDQFCVGMVVCVLLIAQGRNLGKSRLLRLFGYKPVLGLALAGVAYWLLGEIDGVGLLNSSPMFSRGARTVLDHEAKALFAAGLIFAAVTAVPGSGIVGRVFGFSGLRWVGEVSYGFYLWHLAILTLLAGNLAWALGDHGLIADPAGVGITATWQVVSLAVAFSFGVTLLFGWISWRFVERPAVAKSHMKSG